MLKKSKTAGRETDFKTDIPEYSDEEILEIVRKRNHYQPEAAELAIEEAIKRDLIESEQDLFHEDFRTESLKFRLFPNINDEVNKQKIRKSIARGILIGGVIPTIWGFLKMNQGNNPEGSLLVIGGALWILAAARLIRQLNIRLVYTLMVLSALSFLYVVQVLWQKQALVFMDLFIVGVLYGLLIYGLFFLRKLK